MHADEFPNSKLPMTVSMMEDFAKLLNMDDILAVRDMTMYAVMFYGFLRLSECTKLTDSDLVLNEGNQLAILIRDSKTDQTGADETIYIMPTKASYCAVLWLGRYREICNHQSRTITFKIIQNTFKRRLDRH